MKKLIYLSILFLGSASVFAQPNFTFADMPNIGDSDSLNHNPTYTHPGNLDAETGNGYIWDFTNLSFSGSFWAIDSVRAKTHPVSAPYIDATIEYYRLQASGNNLELFSYSNDTLYTHRTGATTGGTSFSPPIASILFPIAFNGSSVINQPLFFGPTQIGERLSDTHYDGIGTLNLPSGETHNNVFRIKSVVRDTTFSTGFTVTYTNYYWYIQGGDIPLLRIYKVDFNGSSGTIYNLYTRKNASPVSSVNETKLMSEVLIYPNPAHSFLQLNGLINNQSFVIYDMSGREKKNGIISDDQKINLQDIQNGMYLLKIGNEMTVRFVKD